MVSNGVDPLGKFLPICLVAGLLKKSWIELFSVFNIIQASARVMVRPSAGRQQSLRF